MTPVLQRFLLSNVACLTGSTMFMFLNAYLLREGMQKWQTGACEGGFWMASVLLQPWLGPQLDRRGRVLFMRSGVLLLMLAALCYARAPVSMAWMLPIRMLQGMGFAFYLTAAWSWLSDHSPPEKMQTYFGVFGLTSLLGSLFGPVAAQLLRHGDPPQDPRVFLSACLALGVSLALLFTLSDAPSTAAMDASPDEVQVSMLQLARRAVLRGPLLGSLSFGLAVGSIFAFGAAYMVHLGIENVAAVFVMLTLVAGLGRGFCGAIASRFNNRNLITLSLISLALGNLGLGSLQWTGPPSLGMLVAVGGVAGLGYGLVYPLLTGLIYQRLPAHERGRGMSLVAACVDGGEAFGATVAGGIAQHLGEGNMFLLMAVLVSLTAALARANDRG